MLTVLFLVDELSYWTVLGQRESVSFLMGKFFLGNCGFGAEMRSLCSFAQDLGEASASRQCLEAGDHVE